MKKQTNAFERNDETEDYLSPVEGEEYRRIAARQLQAYGEENVRKAHAVDARFAMHKQFVGGLGAIDRVHQMARKFKNLPLGLVIVGPPGSGKTTLATYFRESLPGNTLIEPGMASIAMRLREGMTPTYFVQRMLQLVRYPLTRASARDYASRFDIVLDVTDRKGTLSVILDEAHHLIPTSSKAKERSGEGGTISNLLCELMDRGIALVLVGGEGLKNLAQHDQFLASRCAATHVLENFGVGGDWAPLLKNFADCCSDPSLAIIAEKDQVQPLCTATQGNLRKLKMLLAEAVMICGHAGRKAVTVGDLQLAFTRALDQPDRVNPWKTA